MTRLPALSEADVRLRLYPSSGRVVKVTEGYWPSSYPMPDAWAADEGKTWARGADGRVPVTSFRLPVTVESMLSTTSIERRLISLAEWHYRLGEIGLSCGCTACSGPTRTRPEGEPDGNG